jgi:hypothetical protein
MLTSAALHQLLIVSALYGPAAPAVAVSRPLHTLIDQELMPVTGQAPATASDAEFLRRVSLDLTGLPPKADEARAFLADTAADKRLRLIDRLFSSPHYARHLAAMLDLMLMERRPYTNVTADEWQAWLVKCVRENKPWNVMARDIMLADGADPATRPAARFALDRASEPNVLTRDIGRIFFGRDMQCAQCHDHPIVNNYLQSDYQGLFAFLAPSYALVKKEGDKQMTLQAEHAGMDVSFKSVFVGVPRRTGARVPDGVVVDAPFLLPGEEYVVAPADNVKSVPKFSHRTKLAELATSGTNDAFNRNIANRLWAHMFGRGLVHPLDLHHPENPPANPELLRLLAGQIAAMNFDMRGFLREIALSSAYQRSFDPPPDIMALSGKASEEAARLQAERQPMAQATEQSSEAYTKASETWEKAESTMIPVATELDTAKSQYAEAKKKADEAAKAAADAANQLQAKQTAAGPVQQAATAAQEAVKVLPQDKELNDAAQKFVARAAQLVAETAALTKAAEEKKAAVAPMTEAWNKTKPPVDAAVAKVSPLAAAVKENEKVMLAAREKAEKDAEALAAVDRRLTTARKVAELPALNQAVVAANQLVPVREGESAAAQKQVDEFAATVTQSEASAKTAIEAVASAAKIVEAAKVEHTPRAEATNVIVAAFNSADAARQKFLENAALTDIAAKLQERVNEAKAQSDETQKKLDAATAAHKSADEAFVASQEANAKVLAERARREQAMGAAKQALDAAKSDAVTKKAAFDAAMSDLADRWTTDFTIASLKPLTPEQLCWAVFRVTGVYDRYWAAEVAELDKTKPLTEEQKTDPAQVAAREIELEQRTYDKLKSNIGTFVSLYGAAAGQPQGDFFSTADQALFAANGGSINSWVAPAGDNVTDRIIKQADPRVAAEELYLAIFSRKPTEQETTEVVDYLAKRTNDKNVAAQELVWALLNSAEFRFNH